MSDDEELLAVAVAAAQAAAPGLLARFGRAAEGVERKSSSTDLVSEADREAERTIRALLAQRRPHDAVMGEEGDDVPGTSGLRWVVDPLDGTTNYLFANPQWCISVACEGRAGAILDPVRGELWTAVAGGTPQLDGRPLDRLGARDDLGELLVATGFGYEADVRARQAAALARVLPHVRDARRAGAAALDLAWCAAGRVDAYYERGVKAWDVAAGAVLCAAAGLVVRDLEATDEEPAGLLVAPAGVVDELEALVVG